MARELDSQLQGVVWQRRQRGPVKAYHYWLLFLSLFVAALLLSLWLRAGTVLGPLPALEALSARWGDWWRQLTPVPPDKLAVPGAAEQAPPPTSGPAHATVVFDHTLEDQQACLRPRTKSRRDTDQQIFYRWTDDNGQTHMADKRPQGYIATVLDFGMSKQDFSYEILAEDFAIPPGFDGHIAAGSKRMYDVWHFLLGEQRLRQSRIRLRMVGSPARFDAYYGPIAAGRGPVQGFYRMSSNEAVVKADARDPARNLAVAFHEVSHLITASHLGPTPPWLTEGLAGYFETLQVRDQTGVVSANESHMRILRNTALPSLAQYLAIGRDQFYGSDRNLNYAIAWSLMHFLLEGAPGMYALQQLIQQAEAHFCQPFSAPAELDAAYPGGLRRLEKDWRQWLGREERQAHQI